MCTVCAERTIAMVMVLGTLDVTPRSLSLSVQYFKIASGCLVFKVFFLKQIYIIDNRGKWCLDVVRCWVKSRNERNPFP